MDYEFICPICSKITCINSTEEEIPKEVSCLNCFRILIVENQNTILSVGETGRFDVKKKKQV